MGEDHNITKNAYEAWQAAKQKELHAKPLSKQVRTLEDRITQQEKAYESTIEKVEMRKKNMKQQKKGGAPCVNKKSRKARDLQGCEQSWPTREPNSWQRHRLNSKTGGKWHQSSLTCSNKAGPQHQSCKLGTHSMDRWQWPSASKMQGQRKMLTAMPQTPRKGKEKIHRKVRGVSFLMFKQQVRSKNSSQGKLLSPWSSWQRCAKRFRRQLNTQAARGLEEHNSRESDLGGKGDRQRSRSRGRDGLGDQSKGAPMSG